MKTTKIATAIVALGLLAVPCVAAYLPAIPSAPQAAVVDNPPQPQSDVLAVYDAIRDDRANVRVDQPFCEAAADISDRLSLDYFESPVASQVQPDSSRLDLWASQRADSWTLVYVRADGIACVIDSGLDWAAKPPAAELFAAALAEG